MNASRYLALLAFVTTLALGLAAQSESDEGVGLDPNGRTRVTSNGDTGSCIDPMGQPCVRQPHG